VAVAVASGGATSQRRVVATGHCNLPPPLRGVRKGGAVESIERRGDWPETLAGGAHTHRRRRAAVHGLTHRCPCAALESWEKNELGY
jgi:hypothetical protein